mmetsp:Transcript_26042/g.38537  ORF Transcript_26042/g.38537 Transcript_26042/m.38537 type:complete len:569 (-) Transcript_26042:89-1795(-)|eukprot:CAMPEP_0195519002 /NCGR_PEP_ID=MMETSP0794_2-20130614/14147_1 /TAXON_ID=515487 /ORGANISM="Stephanopyxis turris, Strain CCMP 815" /LENGTH=568 /DNA_ID=CAMNT_0040648069 /DNA_START=144 /DNA_END=1853 /DNA_ORIENTATION=+
MSSQSNGVAGRTNYGEWNKKTADLLSAVEKEEEAEKANAASDLGLDGKHARSSAEAEERKKAEQVRKTKDMLDAYKLREASVLQSLDGLLDEQNEEEKDSSFTKYITRDLMDAGHRVLSVSNTKGPGSIILTQDLSNLESAVPTNATLTPKSYEGDAENDVVEEEEEKAQDMQNSRKIYGLIKVFISNVHDCTVVISCKVITGTVEVSHCSNLVLKVVKEGTVATIQADLCQNLSIEFHDAPSGKNTPRMGDGATTVFWGEDKDDRIFHAGISNLNVTVYRDNFVDAEIKGVDYIKEGAVAVGNASAEEVQFLTSMVDGELVTEKVLRGGHSTMSGGARAMTAREMKEVEKRKELIRKAVDEKLGGTVKIMTKDGKEVPKNDIKQEGASTTPDIIQDVYAGMSQSDIDTIVKDCEAQKVKGNEAFAAGEYAQAVLLYTLVLDKTAELPDAPDVEAVKKKQTTKDQSKQPLKQLFPRHIILANRSACFLKLGYHEKALVDGNDASIIEPSYIKGFFRKGLALHAMGQYQKAIESLAVAQKIEPNNKQIKQALQFAEMRMQQQMRKRMQG